MATAALPPPPPPPPPRHLQIQPALPDLIDEILEEVFIRLPVAADRARASMACASFRRVITHHGFLRRFRRLPPPPLLGILSADFLGAQPPHPSAAAARAFADAADLSCSFIPSRDRWCLRDFLDGRTLLSAVPEGSDHDPRALVMDLAVCDPLYRRFRLLPAIPDDLATLVHQQDIAVFEPFLCPPAEDEDGTSFRVICLAQCETKLVIFVYSTSTGQWDAVVFDGWRDLTAGSINPSPSRESELYRRNYVHGCFFWTMHWMNKLFVLGTHSFEFSINLPPAGNQVHPMVVVEAAEGKLGLFTLYHDIENGIYFLWYTILENDDDSTNQWRMEEILPLHPNYRLNILGVAGGYLLLQGFPKSCRPSYTIFSLNLRTFDLEWFCGIRYLIMSPIIYASFPPSLSSPTL